MNRIEILFILFILSVFLLTGQADCLTIVSDIKSDPVRNAMARTPQDVTDTELSILQALWDRQPATIRQLTDRLYPGGGASYYATVQKLLDRLEAKECIVRRRDTSPHVFVAVVGRDELIGRKLEDVADKLCGGSLTPLLTHLVRTRRLSARDRNALRDLIDELDAKNSKHGPRRP
jgi:BlaI family penicillinase repressor